MSQVAMSLLLLVGAGLFLRTIHNLENVRLGFNRRNILLFGIDPTQDGYKGKRLTALYRQLQQRMEALPGVQSASASSNTLIDGGISISGFSLPGSTSKQSETGRDSFDPVYFNDVGAGFFETMGIPLVLGRTIGPEDTPVSPRVALINESLAHKYFGGSNPLGRHFHSNDAATIDIEVVGVVGDAKYGDLRKEVPPTVYLPYTQSLERLGPIHFEVRAAGDPIAMVPAVRRVVQDVDKNLPLFDLKTQVEQIDQSLFQERLFARLSTFFGVLALALACVGLYGMLSYAVAQRTNEIGIRMALGAQGPRILAMVIREGLMLVVIGCIFGVPAALAASRLVRTTLYGLKPTDPITIAIAVALMAAVTIVASYLPAARASRVDPMVALRHE